MMTSQTNQDFEHLSRFVTLLPRKDEAKSIHIMTLTMKRLVLSLLLAPASAFEAPIPVCTASDGIITCESAESYGKKSAVVENDDCGLYMARSAESGIMSIYTGVNLAKGDKIGEPDLMIPVLDRFKTLPYRGQHRMLPWMRFVHGKTDFYFGRNQPLSEYDVDDIHKDQPDVIQFYDDVYNLDVIVPGVGALAPSSSSDVLYADVERDPETKKDSAGLTRWKDPGTGAFTPYHGINFVASFDLPAGSQLFIGDAEKIDWMEPSKLLQQGFCIDNLRVGPSTNGQAGRGAFAKRRFTKGSVIVPTTLAVFRRDDMAIYKSDEYVKHTEYSKVIEKDTIVGKELLQNNCFGHPNSPLLLLPLAPIVNFINHNRTFANAEIQWPDTAIPESFLAMHPLDVYEELQGKLTMNFVATHDIEEGEEIFIDYGKEWEDAWNQHVKDWRAPQGQEDQVVRAKDYIDKGQFQVLTLAEQEKHPYPSNLQTICDFGEDDDDECWLPCTIESKFQDEGQTFYKVYHDYSEHAGDAKYMTGWDCAPNVDVFELETPAAFISIAEKRNASDHHLPGAFRHEIGVPEGFFPSLWNEDAVYKIAELETPLEPGEFRNMTWAHNGKLVTDNAYWVGLPKNFTKRMAEYSEEVGVLEEYRKRIYVQPLEEESWNTKTLKDGGLWYVQRPFNKWNSNQHWIAPYDEIARVSYLRALGRAGFDEVLDRVGRDFGLKGLTCYHNTYNGLSKSDDSYMHTDFEDTNMKSFNVLFPVALVEGSKPELDIESPDQNIVVGVNYHWDYGINTGDWTYHKTAMIDYRSTLGIRVNMSVYCSEITKDNVESLARTYEIEYPAPFQHQFEMPIKEWHWLPGQKLLPK